MMPHRFPIWIIILVTALAIYIDLPSDLSFIRPHLSRGILDLNFFSWRFFRDLEIKKGLDLAGGTHLTLQADMEKIPPADKNNALESLQGIIAKRVNLYGISEPVVQTDRVGSDYRVIVELAGITNLDQALELVGKTAELSFRESDATASATTAAALYGPFTRPTDLSGRDLKKAAPAFDPTTSEPIVQLNFTTEGARKFAAVTGRNLQKPVAIFLDRQLLMAPTVQSVISDGRAVISGKFTAAQTKQLAILLNSGALPAPVKVIEQRTIGATLGRESIDKSILAGIVGLVVIALFMIANYKVLGVFANVALIIYALLILAIFKLIPVTLTLAGIAGFILSIGMAVDANILIFERMKEEIRWGRNKLAAIEVGFSRAFPSIRDSNVSSLITCAILYWFGTGPVRGFAITLGLGILVSLFTAVIVTRTFLRAFEKYV